MVTKGPKYPQGKKILKQTPLDTFIQKRISRLPKEMPEDVKEKLLHDAKFFAEHGGKTDDPVKTLEILKQHERGQKALKDISIDEKGKETIAYPNLDNYMYIQPGRDTKKWVQTVRNLYYRIHKGQDGAEAFKIITSGWDKMEKLDFESWLRFYQEGGHKKYKTAQVNYWEDANRAGYFVPIFPERPKEVAPNTTQQDLDNVKDPGTHPDMNADERRDIIEKQRNKIIGRLDSAEKLMRSHEGQLFAGKEFEALLEIIYQLKKKIHMVNKISTSTRLYEDMIVREANILTKHGFVKAASVLHSIAQAIPNPAAAANPTQMGGMPGNIPGEGPGLTPEGIGPNDTAAPTDPSAEAGPSPAPPGIAAGKNPGQPGDATTSPPPPANPNNFPGDPNSLPGEKVDEPVSEGMKEFLDGLNTGNDTFDNADAIEIHDSEDGIEINDSDDLTVTAQDLAAAPPLAPNDAGLEVKEDQVDPNKQSSKDFDSLVDSAFSGLTVYDVVNKLEEVAKIFKVREIPRQLTLIDLGLNQLGLASLFPSLAEAINKSLESNQYISTRVDDILSKLRGTLQTKNIDLEGGQQEQSPQAQQVKRQLTQENEQEAARKKMRKDMENQELSNTNKVTPEVDVAGEMGGGTPPAAPPANPPPLPTAAPTR